MKEIFKRSAVLTDEPFHYCPGCSHGVITRLLAEVLEGMGLREVAIGVGPVGCSEVIVDYLEIDMAGAAHGRAIAVAIGLKRTQPDKFIFTYQGDGDLAAIGMAETVHAAARGEKISVVFVNNAIFGMTGGQSAPTTLPGQKTTTDPLGRELSRGAGPIRVPELLSSLEGACYLARVSVHTPEHVLKAKRALRRAFECQMKGLGFSLVEVLSTCPPNWHMSPKEATQWVQERMLPSFPLGEFKVPGGGP
ncbi:MAG: thiamine pyrophosphate-dependent enzyme [Nitrospinota bacterium]